MYKLTKFREGQNLVWRDRDRNKWKKEAH